MKSFGQFIFESSQDPYLYHATYGAHQQKIQKEGLHGNSGNKNWSDSEKGKVYLAKKPEVAHSYAETSEDVPESHLKHIIVYKIHKKHLDASKLHHDKNVSGSSDTLEYHGNIAPHHLEIHSEHKS